MRRLSLNTTTPVSVILAIVFFCAASVGHGSEDAVLLQRLALADEVEAAQIEQRLTQIWSRSGSASFDLLLQRGEDALEADNIPAAIEHFTAVLSELLLSSDSIMNKAHQSMRELWRWHAAEEMEHKSVAFDVFLVAFGIIHGDVGNDVTFGHLMVLVSGCGGPCPGLRFFNVSTQFQLASHAWNFASRSSR